MNAIICKNIGVSGYNISWMRSKDGKMFWCRMPIAIMGSTNMSEKELKTVSPFDPRFNDNYVEGKGTTKEEAVKNMEKQISEISESLWY